MNALLCAHCGRPVTKPGATKYCSPACRTAWSNARRTEKYRAVNVSKPYQKKKICLICQVEFTARHPAVNCCDEHRAKKTPTSGPLTCPICGRVEIRRSSAVTCSSQDCRLEHKRRLHRARYQKAADPAPETGDDLISDNGRYRCISAAPEFADMIGEKIPGLIFKSSLMVAALPPGSVYRVGGHLYQVVGDLAPFELCIRGASVSPQSLILIS